MSKDDLSWLFSAPLSASEKMRYQPQSTNPSEYLPDTPTYNLQQHLKYVQDLWHKYPYRDPQVCAEKAADLVVECDYTDGAVGEELAAMTARLLEANEVFITDMPTLEYAPYLTRMQKRLTLKPDFAFYAVKDFLEELKPFLIPEETGGSYSMPLYTVLSPVAYIGSIYKHFHGATSSGEYVFENLRAKLFRNLVNASGFDPDTYDGKRKLTIPAESDLSREDMYLKYLDETPFVSILALNIPFSIPLETQFAHTWVVAGSGHGKTTALTAMLSEHLPYVLKGERSIVVLDSQNSLIPAIERLKIWENNDRLIIIDPAEPVAFSLFDYPDNLLDTAIELVDFVFAKLSSSEQTYRQKNMFEYLTEFLITAVPNATIYDFRNMLDVNRAKDYDKYIPNASQEVQDYLTTDFVKEKFTVDARQQVITKMRGMLRKQAFSQMFGSRTTKLNLLNELNRGVCILIKPDSNALGDDGTLLFGRFWIAQMQLVARQRQLATKKTPTFFYIDECQDYISGDDPKLEKILEQARKQNMGLTLLHHYGQQLKSKNLLDLLGACTSTKIVGSLNDADLARFSTYLQCKPSFIQAQDPEETFAVGIRGKKPPHVALAFPYINLATEPQMSEETRLKLRARNRDRYGADPRESELYAHAAANAQAPPKESLRTPPPTSESVASSVPPATVRRSVPDVNKAEPRPPETKKPKPRPRDKPDPED